jgi:hypothetical protein
MNSEKIVSYDVGSHEEQHSKENMLLEKQILFIETFSKWMLTAGAACATVVLISFLFN